jgi:hypothetical protein
MAAIFIGRGVAEDMKTINYKMGLINNISNINVKNFDIPGANIRIAYLYSKCTDCRINIYIRLKIKPNSVRIRFLSCQIFVLPSTGFELTYIFVRNKLISQWAKSNYHGPSVIKRYALTIGPPIYCWYVW